MVAEIVVRQCVEGNAAALEAVEPPGSGIARHLLDLQAAGSIVFAEAWCGHDGLGAGVGIVSHGTRRLGSLNAWVLDPLGACGAAEVPLIRVALLVRGQRLKGRCPVMQRPADRIMNGLKGGDWVMESQEAEHAVLHAQDSASSAGRTRLQPQLNFSSRIRCVRAKKRRTLLMRGAAVWGRPLVGRSGVWTVSTL